MAMLLHWGGGYWRDLLADHLAVSGYTYSLRVDLADIDPDDHVAPAAASAVLRVALWIEEELADHLEGLDQEGLAYLAPTIDAAVRYELDSRDDESAVQEPEHDDWADQELADDDWIDDAPAEVPMDDSTEEDPDSEMAFAPRSSEVVRFGDRHEWRNGVAITVDEPRRMPQSDDGRSFAVRFDIEIFNGSQRPIDHLVRKEEVQSADEDGTWFLVNPWTDDRPQGAPRSRLLPGRTARWSSVYRVKDPNDIVFEVAPEYWFRHVFFTTG